MLNHKKFRFAIDRGGTFTDLIAYIPNSDALKTCKLLSVDPTHYEDAPTEGIRRILNKFSGKHFEKAYFYDLESKIDSSLIEWIRMGTTVATNSLLERNGERTVITKGFKDILLIGDQSRPNIFEINIKRPEVIYEDIVECNERIAVVSEDQAKNIESKDNFIPAFQDCETTLGTTGEKIVILKAPDIEKLKSDLLSIFNRGIHSIAVALLHSYIYPNHELLVKKIAEEIGFKQISISSELMPMVFKDCVKIVPRALTTCVDAYLSPCIQTYISDFCSGFDSEFLKNTKIHFMQSDGALAAVDDFNGFRAILSGPAGGLIAISKAIYNEFKCPCIGFDMGGTSTDVCRYSGIIEHKFENTVSGITIQAPQLDIITVAAGGGSRLFFEPSGLFRVGPESASAHPGPICYRKNGWLTITDANLYLGRIIPDFFPKIFGQNANEPLWVEGSAKAFAEITIEINNYLARQTKSKPLTSYEIALGFISVAVEAMCRPIRQLTQSKGFDVTTHLLVTFGGAGGQHACAIARSLGIQKVIIHRLASFLCSYGIALADVAIEGQRPCALDYTVDNVKIVQSILSEIAMECKIKLKKQGFDDDDIEILPFLHLRFFGTATAVMTSPDENGDYLKPFLRNYQQEYGFILSSKVCIDDIRIRAIGRHSFPATRKFPAQDVPPKCVSIKKCYFDHEFYSTNVYILQDLLAGHVISGPAIILGDGFTSLIEPDCTASITSHGDILLEVPKSKKKNILGCDPIELSVFSHRFMSIAEQMGKTLQRTSISTNIKERLDFSCALFDQNGLLVANAPHLPVHLGAMQEAVRWQIQHLKSEWGRSDVIVSNSPLSGGSHLPDITVMTPMYCSEFNDPICYVASRGHHADIGGLTPGSMPPFSKFLREEGMIISSFKLVNNGKFDKEGITEILKIYGARNISDNMSDLEAQVAANQKGITLFGELINEYNVKIVQDYMRFLQDSSELAVREMLRTICSRVDRPFLSAEDYMDDGTCIKLTIKINKESGDAFFDFTGTGIQVFGNCNTPPAVTLSAIIYCLRCMINQDIPLNHGCLKPVRTFIPNNSILSPDKDLAVVAGNVLTSQRICDVIFKAFETCAASQGCMNNLTFGSSTFGYYETIGGGSGAGNGWNGVSGVHTHMTNTKITDAEILERRYPVLLHRFSFRNGSGGIGKYYGGDGIVRHIEFLTPLQVSILSDRRCFRPYGLKGGGDGQTGRNSICRKGGDLINLSGKNTYQAISGDSIIIETPGISTILLNFILLGGGGFGIEENC